MENPERRIKILATQLTPLSRMSERPDFSNTNSSSVSLFPHERPRSIATSDCRYRNENVFRVSQGNEILLSRARLPTYTRGICLLNYGSSAKESPTRSRVCTCWLLHAPASKLLLSSLLLLTVPIQSLERPCNVPSRFRTSLDRCSVSETAYDANLMRRPNMRSKPSSS